MPFKYVRQPASKLDERANQQGGAFEGFIKDEYQTYRVGKGDHWIRILPPTWSYADGRAGDHFAMELWVHFSVGPDNASVICPNRMRDQPCPLCEARIRAERSGDEKQADELRPIKRALMWILDRKEERKGAIVWAAPWTVERDISKICRDKTSGVIYYIDDPEEGFDITFEREGEGRQTKYSGIQLVRRPSSVPPKIIDYIEERPLQDTLRWRNYDEIRKLYEGTGKSDDDDDRPARTRRRTDDEDRPARTRRDDDDDRPRRRGDDDSDERPRNVRREADDRWPDPDDVERDRAAVGQRSEDVERRRPHDDPPFDGARTVRGGDETARRLRETYGNRGDR